MFVNNLKLIIPTQTSILNLTPAVAKRKTKGINIFYNVKLNAISGLHINKRFDKSLLKLLLIKKRDNSIKYLIASQSQLFQNLIVTRRKNSIFFKNVNSYKALRLDLGLPIRGQRSHTNAKTARKLNKTV
jgi:ribosomal protein S13